jgi:hypothetical protein
MPEDSNTQKRLKILPRRFDPSGKSGSAEEAPGHAEGNTAATPKRRRKKKSPRNLKAEFLARLASKVPRQKPPDVAVAPSGDDLPENLPKPHDPSGTLETEGWESSSPARASDVSSGPSDHLTSGDLMRLWRMMARRKIRAVHALAVLGAAVVVAVLLSSIVTWNLGVQSGIRRLLEEQTKADVSVSEDYLARLNRAFEDLRAGNPGNALKTFRELEAENPGVSSMAYLVALAAMRSKNFALAEEQAARSIRKQERISDSMAIQALIEMQKSEDPNTKKLGDHVLRSELLLRRAMLADPANPVPMIELASLLRGQKKNAEAIQLLQAARTRVQPFDLPPFLEATIVLATLQSTPDSQLPSAGDPGKDLPAAIAAAYLSMRKAQFGEAAKSLKAIRNQTTPSSFRYLMNDQAMRPYSGVLELREFFY